MVLPLDYARMEIEVYRTRKNESAPFYRIRNVEVPYPILNYIDIYDSTDDALLTDLDYNTSSLTSQELSSGLNLPPKAACLTSASNRLLLGACTSTPSFTVTVADGQTANATTEDDYIDAKLELLACDGVSGYVFQFTNSKVSTGTGMAPRMITDGITHASGVATVKCTDVGSATSGDWVYLFRAATGADPSPTMSPRYAGWHKITSVNATGNTYSFAVNSDGINSLDDSTDYYYGNEVESAVYIPSGVIPVYVGLDDAYNNTVEGNSSIPQIKNMPMLGRAINTVMALESEDSFWAEYGNDITPLGTVIVKNVCDTFQAKWTKPPAATGAARIFINGSQIAGSGSSFVDAVTTFRGSRIVKSYPNYVECFDNPDAENASTSDSIIDVNPADGEIITAMIPLIGPSTTTSSQLQGTVIVFKEKSIYAVDVEKNSFEKLETNGVGAAYPNSVSHTSGGLAFATSSGVYKIDRSLRISKISTPVDKDIKAAQTTDISRLQGHGFPAGNQYKLSLSDDSVLVYNYDREVENKPGAWCEYTNHPVAGGWATSGSREFFASTLGRVFVNRTSGTIKDYRDDSNTPIAFNVTFRATNFGDAAIRKQVRHVNIGFRNTLVESVATAVSCGFECSTDFTTLDTFTIESTAASSISQLRFGVPNGRMNYIQMRVQNSAIDEPIEITGITYKVAGLKVSGTEEAKSTKTR
jgi:hypothetical protein